MWDICSATWRPSRVMSVSSVGIGQFSHRSRKIPADWIMINYNFNVLMCSSDRELLLRTEGELPFIGLCSG